MKQTQNERIYQALKKRPGRPVPMPLLSRIGSGVRNGFCMVHSRIADLRRDWGCDIEHTQERKDGKHLSFYTLKG